MSVFLFWFLLGVYEVYMYGVFVCVCEREIDSIDEGEVGKIRWDKGFWKVRVFIVLGIFEVYFMMN